MQSLTLPDGTQHHVADEGEVIDRMTLAEVQALLMAFTDLLCNVHGEQFLTTAVELARVYHDSLPADTTQPSDPPQDDGYLVLDGQEALDV